MSAIRGFPPETIHDNDPSKNPAVSWRLQELLVLDNSQGQESDNNRYILS